MPDERYKTFVCHILRYTSDLVRDEWLNIGILLFDPQTGERSIRLIDEEREFARLRRLQPSVDEELIRRTRDHLDDHFEILLRQFHEGSATAAQDFQKLIEKWGCAAGQRQSAAPLRARYPARRGHRTHSNGRVCRVGRQAQADAAVIRL